jgi:hypothetical protein
MGNFGGMARTGIGLTLGSGMKRVIETSEQVACMEAYFAATRRPPEQQVHLRSVSRELFSRSVIVSYTSGGRMLGGFCLVTEPPIPLLASVPEAERREIAILRDNAEEDFVSVAFLWLDEGARGFIHSARVWLCMLSVINQLGHPFLMYSYKQSERQNWQLYRRGGRAINIYQGLMSNGAEGGVDYVPLRNLSAPIDYLTRFLGRHSRLQPAMPLLQAAG